MNKRVWVLPAAVVLGLAIASAQENRKSTNATDDILIADERALHDAVAKADRSAFLLLAAPEGAWTTPQGFVPMHLLADGLSEFHLSKSEIVNPRVTQLNDDAAVLLSVWTVTGTFGNQPLPATMLSSTVWAKRNGRWMAVHHQDTELKRD
jgi:hypothetical protein